MTHEQKIIYIYIYIYWTDMKYVIYDLIDKVTINRIRKHFHTFRKETWTMDRRTRAVMFVKQIVHSPPQKKLRSIGQFYTTVVG